MIHPAILIFNANCTISAQDRLPHILLCCFVAKSLYFTRLHIPSADLSAPGTKSSHSLAIFHTTQRKSCTSPSGFHSFLSPTLSHCQPQINRSSPTSLRPIIWFAPPSQHIYQQPLATPHAAFRHHRRKPRISSLAFTDHFFPTPIPAADHRPAKRPYSPSRLVDRSALPFAAHAPETVDRTPAAFRGPSPRTSLLPFAFPPSSHAPSARL